MAEEAASKVGLNFLGEGSFGKIYYYDRQVTVYKTVSLSSNNEQLLREFEIYLEAYNTVGSSSEGGCFRVPQAWQYWKPGYGSPAQTSSVNKGRESVSSQPQIEETVDSGLWAGFSHAALTMDMIPSLHPLIIQEYKNLFWSEDLQISNLTVKISLSRLYFGRENLPEKHIALQDGLKSDPPLSIDRYEKLAQIVDVNYGIKFPSVEMVSEGMGGVLAKLHWGVGINARDIELVLGGLAHGVQCYAFDFNQCQRWLILGALPSRANDSSIHLTTGNYTDSSLKDCMKRLATLIYGQELYYPRPHQTQPYTAFRKGYMATVESLLEQYILPQEEGIHDLAEFCVEVKEASSAFFMRYEELDKEKTERLQRQKAR